MHYKNLEIKVLALDKFGAIEKLLVKKIDEEKLNEEE